MDEFALPKVYAVPCIEFCDLDCFTISDWNEKAELPELAKEFIAKSRELDLVYTVYNFMLDFNMNDVEGVGDVTELWIFIPDPKFDI